MPRQGLGVLREQTEAFIAENPYIVALVRNTKVSDGAGGWTTTPLALSPQVVRLVPQSRLVSVERRTVGGEMTKPDMNMLATYDADVEVGDTFTWNGRTVEVVWIHATGYEKTCEVAVR